MLRSLFLLKSPPEEKIFWTFLWPILLICGGRSRSLKVLSGQTTTWLLHVQEHLPRLNVAPYSLEMSENIRKFIWLICLKVIIGKRAFLFLLVNWNVTNYLIHFGPCFTSVSRWFLFVHPPGILLSFRHWLNIFWNLRIACKRDPNRSLLALRTELTILLGKINDKLSSRNLVCLAGARVLGDPLSIPSREEILSLSWLAQSFIQTPLMNTFVAWTQTLNM